MTRSPPHDAAAHSAAPCTRLAGLIGSGIDGSRSPEMHEREAARQGLPLVYRLLDFAAMGLDASDVPAVIDWAERLGFDGLNVTHPFKQAVIPCVTHLSPEAEALQAVNTIVFGEGGRRGYNTDVFGFAENLRIGLPGIRCERVAQVGAGGAAAATGYALLKLGTRHLAIHDPIRERADALAARLGGLFPGARIRSVPDMASAAVEAEGIVQASPVGMSSHPGLPFDPAVLRAGQWVSDIIYFPEETALLQAARLRGCEVLGGLGMAAYQAAEAFTLFTGLTADGARLLESLRAYREQR